MTDLLEVAGYSLGAVGSAVTSAHVTPVVLAASVLPLLLGSGCICCSDGFSVVKVSSTRVFHCFGALGFSVLGLQDFGPLGFQGCTVLTLGAG